MGYPNVGKSTLVNRLAGSREAVVHEQAGVTRDRKEVEADWNGRSFLLVDTGGVDLDETGDLARAVQAQARAAIAEADVAVFVVDTRAGLRPGDLEVGAELRAGPVPVWWRPTRSTAPRRSARPRSSTAGAGRSGARLGQHGLGTGDLLDRVDHAARGRARREETSTCAWP